MARTNWLNYQCAHQKMPAAHRQAKNIHRIIRERTKTKMKILYTAEATVQGGREGHASTSDGALDVKLSTPKSLGGSGDAGTNPEQLFAVGYAACFQSALMLVARRQHVDASQSVITSKVGIGLNGEGVFVR